MFDREDQQLLSDIARELIADIAPQELPLFRATSAAYFADPERVEKERGGNDAMLGFGVDAAIASWTPIVLTVTSAVVGFLREEIKDSAKGETSGLVGAWMKQLFKKFRPPDDGEGTVPPLTPEQLTQVREQALKKARQLKLPPGQAGMLADAIVGGLAVSRS